MGSELRARLLELMEIRKQRELTPEEQKEGYRLFKKAVLEPCTGPLKSKIHTGENEIPWSEKQAIRRQCEQHVPDSPAKTRGLRMWELADINTYERKMTAEERAEMLKLVMDSMMEDMMETRPKLAAEVAALIREVDEEQTDIK
jgi:hypothetical protein